MRTTIARKAFQNRLSKQLDDRASKSIVKVKDILKQVKLEEKRGKAIRKKENLIMKKKEW